MLLDQLSVAVLSNMNNGSAVLGMSHNAKLHFRQPSCRLGVRGLILVLMCSLIKRTHSRDACAHCVPALRSLAWSAVSLPSTPMWYERGILFVCNHLVTCSMPLTGLQISTFTVMCW